MSVVTTYDSGDPGHTTAFPNRVTRGTVAIGAYATNGIAVTRSNFGLSSLDDLRLTASGGYVPEWDKTNAKIKVYWVDTSVDGAPLDEVANSTDLAAVGFRFQATGR